MKIRQALLFCGIVLIIASAGCAGGGTGSGMSVADKRTPESFMAGQKGKVVVLLMGASTCPGTRAGTEVLAELKKTWPSDVVPARLDVPMPNATADPIKNWPHSYFYAVDTGRIVADRFNFFYYPTLYIIDRDGEVRFAGSCNADKVKAMVSEIRAEKAGSKKKFYIAQLPAVGTAAPGFAAKDIDGKNIDLQKFQAKGATLLFFTSVGCPFSKEAARKLPAIEKKFHNKSVSVVTIEKGDATAAKSLYSSIALRGPVILDADGAVSRKYGVEPIPFYFVINARGQITGRGPYTEASAHKALLLALNLSDTKAAPEERPGAG